MSESSPRKWTAPWVDELTPEERDWLESLPLDDYLPPGETEVIVVPPGGQTPKP